MLTSASMLAGYSILFKYLQLESGFRPTKFWEYIGESVVALSFGLSAANRRALIAAWGRGPLKASLSLLLPESLNVTGGLLFTYALTIGPTALVFTISGIHPFLY